MEGIIERRTCHTVMGTVVRVLTMRISCQLVVDWSEYNVS